jgi:chromosome segregation ATPase
MGIRLFFIGLIVTALAGGGFYVMKLQKDNAILKANAIKMESAIADQKTLIENQKKDFEAILTANKEMNELIGKLKTDFADLDKRFNKKNRDVGLLAIERLNQLKELLTLLV